MKDSLNCPQRLGPQQTKHTLPGWRYCVKRSPGLTERCSMLPQLKQISLTSGAIDFDDRVLIVLSVATAVQRDHQLLREPGRLLGNAEGCNFG
jgi:alkylhydroperoxidase/carboxymuconolactone decarboxylase family protein YurZ